RRLPGFSRDWSSDVRSSDLLERLESMGVTYDHAYCAVPICTPSRASMWTGVHAKETGLWDNTNFAWIGELSPEIPTVGHMLREQIGRASCRASGADPAVSDA